MIQKGWKSDRKHTLPHSRDAVQIGDFIFFSSLYPEDTTVDVALQATSILNHMDALLKLHGLTFQHVVKLTIQVKDAKGWSTIEPVLSKYVGDAPLAIEVLTASSMPFEASVCISGQAIDTRKIESLPEGNDPCDDCSDENCPKNGGKRTCENGTCWD